MTRVDVAADGEEITEAPCIRGSGPPVPRLTADGASAVGHNSMGSGYQEEA